MHKRIVDGEEAARLGLVNECVEDDRLMERTMELATELANGPQVSMRLLKRAVYNAASLTFDQAGDDIASKTAISDFHRDAVEGAPAFFAREPAHVQQVADRGRSEPRVALGKLDLPEPPATRGAATGRRLLELVDPRDNNTDVILWRDAAPTTKTPSR